MLDTSVRVVGNVTNTGNCFETDVTNYPGFEGPDIDNTFMALSSATKEKRPDCSSVSEDDISPLTGQELSQDLYSLIDSFNLETPMEHFGSGNSAAFQFVIDDVIDASPSGDEFDFLDNICGFSTSDVPVKNNSSSTTCAPCVYTCAADKDRCVNHVTCARTASSTCISNAGESWETLSPADQELLEKLPVFLENIDSVVTTKKSNGCVRATKREHEADPIEEHSRKRTRSEDSHEVLKSVKENRNNLSHDNICARGS